MKFFQLLSMLALCAIIPMTSCSDSAKEERADEARKTLPVTPPANNVTSTSNSPLLDAPTTSSSNPEPHYKCPNNDGGTGPSAGKCPICGADMAHNQAYHNQSTPSTNPATPPPATPEPAQNAAGVWHYICMAGCSGGAGSAGSCSGCGGALTHNSAYHN